MSSTSVLLIQARHADDPMSAHERGCVRRRLGVRPTTLVTRNALSESPEPGWLDSVDTVIFGGSGDYSVHHPRSRPWVSALRHVLDAVLHQALPAFGICFGHQLLAHHLGTPVLTSDSRAEIGTIDLELTDDGAGDPLFSALEPQFLAHTGHSDCVTETPPGVELLVRGETLATQAFKVRGAPFYSTQFHPDMTGSEAVSRYLAYRRVLSPAEVDAAGRFRPGADATACLLGQFVDLVAQVGTSKVAQPDPCPAQSRARS